MKVLVVEDNQFSRTLVSGLLRNNGYAVHACSTAAQALESIQRETPDLVIADLDLGKGPTGIDVLRAVRRVAPDLPAIILSGHRSPLLVDMEAEVLPQGIIYLVKSDMESDAEILAAVKAALSGDSYQSSAQAPTELKYITRTQAAILKMLARGMSNEAIATQRGTSVRAVENLIRRTFRSLDIVASPDSNARVQAAIAYLNDSSLTVE